MTSIDEVKSSYARLVVAIGGSCDERLIEAFSSVDRQRFVGPGPWSIYTLEGYVSTDSDDPTVLYQDILIGLITDRFLNNGPPSLHARCFAALNVAPGSSVVHVGAGTGYYTAVLAHLVGTSGVVRAYEVDPELAQKAARNLADFAHVTVSGVSGASGCLPMSDIIYVSAGATHPTPTWLDALKPNGRLLFPLTPNRGWGQCC